MEEIWKDIPGYDGYYRVSNMSHVLNVKTGVIRTPNIDHRGRMTIGLIKDGVLRSFSFPRLVAMAFIRMPKEEEEVNHLDENPLNNNPDNLEWCDHKYNCNYGTRIQRIKEKQNIPVLQYTLDGKFIAEYASMHIAAEAINAEAGHICDCCLGNRKCAYGYFWRYRDEKLYQQAKVKIEKKTKTAKKSRADKFAKNALNVIQMTMEGNVLAIYPSSKFAADAVGSFRPMIINCCNGKIPHVKGYKFIYERDYLKQTNNKYIQFSFW